MIGFEKHSDRCCHQTVTTRCGDCPIDKPAEKCYTVSLTEDEMVYIRAAVGYGAGLGSHQAQKLLDKLNEIC
jgi:hypothetical protein